MSRDAVFSTAIAVGALLTGFLFVVEADSWLRAAVTTLFLLCGPGLAVTQLLRIDDAMTVTTVAVATSLGLETVVSMALLVTGHWSPGTALAIIVILTVGGVVIAVGQGDREPDDGFRQAALAALGTGDGKGKTE